MPIQSGVSVTVSPHSRDPGLLHASKRRPSKEGLDKVSRIGCSIADISAPQRRLYWNLRTKTPTTTTSLLRRRVARLRNWRRSGKPSLNLSLRDIDWMITAWFRLFRLQAGGEPSSCGKCLSHFGIVRHAMHGKSSELISLDLILERQKSSGGTSRHNSVGQQPSRPAPSTHTSVLPAREAAIPLLPPIPIQLPLNRLNILQSPLGGGLKPMSWVEAFSARSLALASLHFLVVLSQPRHSNLFSQTSLLVRRL